MIHTKSGVSFSEFSEIDAVIHEATVVLTEEHQRAKDVADERVAALLRTLRMVAPVLAHETPVPGVDLSVSFFGMNIGSSSGPLFLAIARELDAKLEKRFAVNFLGDPYGYFKIITSIEVAKDRLIILSATKDLRGICEVRKVEKTVTRYESSGDCKSWLEGSASGE